MTVNPFGLNVRGGRHDGGVVAEVRQRHRRRSHQRAVARRALRVVAEGTRGDRGELGTRGGTMQHRGGGDPDVGRAGALPGEEAVTDRLDIDVAGRDHLGDADGHRGVVGPLARRDTAEATADHGDLTARVVPEVVAGPESVACGHANEHPGDPVGGRASVPSDRRSSRAATVQRR